MPKIILRIKKGGAGSGHHGHAGRPGKRGGSAPGGSGGGSDGGKSAKFESIKNALESSGADLSYAKFEDNAIREIAGDAETMNSFYDSLSDQEGVLIKLGTADSSNAWPGGEEEIDRLSYELSIFPNDFRTESEFLKVLGAQDVLLNDESGAEYDFWEVEF